MRLNVGAELDGFTVVGMVGQGATSEVYLVRDQRTGAERALKLLTVIGGQHRARLEREAQTVAGLLHPNLVGVFGLLDPVDGTAVVMEYIRGPTLYDWLIEVQPDEAQAVWLWRAMLRGLVALHEHELIHRDIKPGNILLAVSGEGIEPKLADYGLIKDVSRVDRQTQTGMGMGTPAYMAPEQLKDSSRVDHRADLYSLACVLFEMLSGQLPFVRDDWWETYKAIEAGTRARFGLLPPDLSPGLVSILRALLEPDPDDRPADATEVLALLDEHGIVGRPVGVSTDEWRAAQRMADQITNAGQDSKSGTSNRILPGAQSLASADRQPVAEPSVVDASPHGWGRRNRILLWVAGGLTAALLLGVAGGVWSRWPSTAIETEPMSDVQPVTGRASVRAVQPPMVDVDVDAGVTEPTKAPRNPPRKSPRNTATRSQPPVTQPGGPAPEVVAVIPVDGPSTAQAEPHTAIIETSSPVPLAPAPVQTAAVRFKGDMADAFLLSDDGERLNAGSSIPAGSYQVRVRWQPQDDVMSAGRVQVAPGAEVTLTCRSSFLRCAP